MPTLACGSSTGIVVPYDSPFADLLYVQFEIKKVEQGFRKGQQASKTQEPAKGQIL